MSVFIDYSASVGSEEESGKDWDELEEEARKGLYRELVDEGIVQSLISRCRQKGI